LGDLAVSGKVPFPVPTGFGSGKSVRGREGFPGEGEKVPVLRVPGQQLLDLEQKEKQEKEKRRGGVGGGGAKEIPELRRAGATPRRGDEKGEVKEGANLLPKSPLLGLG